MDNDLLKIGLPKWPQMVVSGEPVTVSQAKEIIRRTDTFFTGPEYAGNDRKYNMAIAKKLNIPVDYEEQCHWREKWGYIDTSYVHNTWISSAFVLGPSGWCNPTGNISFTHNVGKWPSVVEVLFDWEILAREFPFLKLEVTLMSGEEFDDVETVPLVSIKVCDGKAEVYNPTSFVKTVPISDEDYEAAFLSHIDITGYAWEHGISDTWIEEWAEIAKSLGLS